MEKRSFLSRWLSFRPARNPNNRRVRLEVTLLEDRIVPTVYNVDPSTYQAVLPTLAAGDVMNMAAGTYTRLRIDGLNGNSAEWITIAGPTSGSPAIVQGQNGFNTVEIVDSSFVAIENLTIDSLDIPGHFGISAKDGLNNLTHNIRIENNTILGTDGSQQTVGISTKTPTWGWIIRDNRIIGSGTGLYLGNSDGSDQFIAGIIEGNYFEATIGYSMQIKYQNARPTNDADYTAYYAAGMPTAPTNTIIRHNVFNKGSLASPDGDRPTLLVGGFPGSGTGSQDLYEIYGNFFYNNPREAHIQASGRASIHDNILVSSGAFYPAINARNHDLPIDLAHIYNNTIYDADIGIGVYGNPVFEVVGNLVFADTPFDGFTADASNISDSIANAGNHVANPSTVLGVMNFYPLTGQAQGTPLDLSPFTGQTDYLFDFNQDPKGSQVFRGAYAGAGANPGWQLQGDNKPYSDNPGTAPANRYQRGDYSLATLRTTGIPRFARVEGAQGTSVLIVSTANSAPPPKQPEAGGELVSWLPRFRRDAVRSLLEIAGDRDERRSLFDQVFGLDR